MAAWNFPIPSLSGFSPAASDSRESSSIALQLVILSRINCDLLVQWARQTIHCSLHCNLSQTLQVMLEARHCFEETSGEDNDDKRIIQQDQQVTKKWVCEMSGAVRSENTCSMSHWSGKDMVRAGLDQQKNMSSCAQFVIFLRTQGIYKHSRSHERPQTFVAVFTVRTVQRWLQSSIDRAIMLSDQQTVHDGLKWQSNHIATTNNKKEAIEVDLVSRRNSMTDTVKVSVEAEVLNLKRKQTPRLLSQVLLLTISPWKTQNNQLTQLHDNQINMLKTVFTSLHLLFHMTQVDKGHQKTVQWNIFATVVCLCERTNCRWAVKTEAVRGSSTRTKSHTSPVDKTLSEDFR